MPFGYGPAAKLLTLAHGLRRDWRLVFVGRGAALELASRAPEAFDEILASDDPAVPRRVAAAWGVLSVMDRDAGRWAAGSARPLFVLDSLLWMRAEIPQELAGARIYWAQAFPGLHAERYVPSPRIIGPIVSPRGAGSGNPRCQIRCSDIQRKGLVVHLGGSAAPDGRGSLYAAYARCVQRAVVQAGLARRFGHVTILCGAEAARWLESAPRGEGLHVASVSHAEARERMAGAAAVLTAPGLTTTLECFADATPTWFLPPQNYSQWCILRRLRASGAADRALHWEDLDGVRHLEERIPARLRDPVVRQVVESRCDDPGFTATLGRALARVGDAPVARTASQAAFLGSLGPAGSEAIVSTLARARAAEPVDRSAPLQATRLQP